MTAHTFRIFPGLQKPIYELLQSKPGIARISARVSNAKCPQLSPVEPVDWTTEHQEALERLVTLLTNPAILAFPDFNFTLHTDTSDQGLGAVLYQR